MNRFFSTKKVLLTLLCLIEAALLAGVLLPWAWPFSRFSTLAVMMLLTPAVLWLGCQMEDSRIRRAGWGITWAVYALVILCGFFLCLYRQEGILTLDKLRDVDFLNRNLSLGLGHTWRRLVMSARLGDWYFWGNLLFLAPLGLFLSLGRKKMPVWQILLAGLLLSLGVEVLQLVSGKGVLQLDVVQLVRLAGCGLGIAASRIPQVQKLFFKSTPLSFRANDNQFHAPNHKLTF